MTLSGASSGKTPTNSAGRMAKYFATSFAIENVVSVPRVISSCLPTSTTSRSFVGSESRSTMLPASLAACVPVFMATPTSACASAGASLVPSPVIATSLPLPCSSLMSCIFVSGVACARKSSTPDSRAMAAAVRGLSPVIITVRIPMARKRANRSAMPPLHHVLQVDEPEKPCAIGHCQRRPAGVGDLPRGLHHLLGHLATLRLDVIAHRVHGALAHVPLVQVASAHARLRAERDEMRDPPRLPAAQL